MGPKTYFLSDLHLFSRRSLAPWQQEAIEEATAKASTLVLGGDIFDFRWSMLPSLNRSIDAAVAWLGDLAAQNSKCDLHFVLGNHDYNRTFLAELDSLASTTGNLHWHRTHFRLGQSLFLHGDVADKPELCHQKLLLRRQKYWADEPPQGAVANRLYDLAMQANLHQFAKLVHRHRRVTSRLRSYVERIGHGEESGLRNVYFGHTHYALRNYEREGIVFHNGGAPMKGLRFEIVPVET